MKKRILGLMLCLVMLVSLLPVTAFAYSHEEAESWAVGIESGKTYCGDTYFTFDLPADRTVKTVFFDSYETGKRGTLIPDSNGYYKLEAGLGYCLVHIEYNGEEALTTIAVTINDGHTDNDWDHSCDFCGADVHTWRCETSEAGDTLTAKCLTCGIAPVSLTLKADSVTLPDSPFNARLEGWDAFRQAIPGAENAGFVYKYKGPEDSGYSAVAPAAANAKAGEYQVGVRISGLPVDKEHPPVAYSLEDGVNQGFGDYADLYVQYTAADPKVTAQTGDNRPIEIMMAGMVVFSTLAAAAFIVDSRRKYSR